MEKKIYQKEEIKQTNYIVKNNFMAPLSASGGEITEENEGIIIDKIQSCYSVGNKMESFLADKTCGDFHYFGTYTRTGKTNNECIDFSLMQGTYTVELKKTCDADNNIIEVTGRFTKVQQ